MEVDWDLVILPAAITGVQGRQDVTDRDTKWHISPLRP